MKVREVPTRKMLERTAEMVSNEIFESLRIETVVNIIATARYFGLGKKRMEKYIGFLDEVRHEFLKYQADDILNEKLDEETEKLGFSISDLFDEVPTHKELMRRSRAKKKNVSLAEAYELSKKLDSIKNSPPVTAITDRLGVSPPTIRSDLQQS